MRQSPLILVDVFQNGDTGFQSEGWDPRVGANCLLGSERAHPNCSTITPSPTQHGVKYDIVKLQRKSVKATHNIILYLIHKYKWAANYCQILEKTCSTKEPKESK